jgi:hypothetical protein
MKLVVYLYRTIKQLEIMENLLNEFMTSPLHIKGLLIFWGVCVVLFYASTMYLIYNMVVSSLKKLF